MKYAIDVVNVRKRARLPHWEVAHGIYFVTFNLFDAIPAHVRLRIREEADAQAQHISSMRGTATIAEKRAIEEWVRRKVGESLDESFGACFMRNPRIAQIVADAITFDGDRYDLFGWSVMPNHVHAIFSLADEERLDATLHSWKSYSAKKANALLGRRGQFWQDDYFDHTIRDDRELEETIAYVLNNPTKAGLIDWPFVGGRASRPPAPSVSLGAPRTND